MFNSEKTPTALKKNKEAQDAKMNFRELPTHSEF